MPTAGLVTATSNGCEIRGNWYWYKDDLTTNGTTVTSPVLASASPVVATGAKACLRGSTVVNTAAWGAGIGFNLNAQSATTPRLYDANSHGIGGFEITIEGDIPQGLRVHIGDLSKATPPFVPIARPGTYRIRFADAFVPLGWPDLNAGKGVDSTGIAYINFQIVGGSVAKTFDYCISNVIPLPINDDGSMGTKPVTFVRLPITSNNAVKPTDTTLGIQGGYYCSVPTASTFQCGDSATAVNAPFSTTTNDLFLSGKMGTDYVLWGGNIGLSLNASGMTNGAWNGLANRLRGFRFKADITGNSSPLPVRFSTSSVATPADGSVSPFVEFAQPGQHWVEMGSVACPGWEGTPCTEPALSSLYFLEVQVPTLKKATTYVLRVPSLEVMLAK